MSKISKLFIYGHIYKLEYLTLFVEWRTYSHRQTDRQNLFLFRNEKTPKVNILFVLTQVKYSITFLLRGSENTNVQLK